MYSSPRPLVDCSTIFQLVQLSWTKQKFSCSTRQIRLLRHLARRVRAAVLSAATPARCVPMAWDLVARLSHALAQASRFAWTADSNADLKSLGVIFAKLSSRCASLFHSSNVLGVSLTAWLSMVQCCYVFWVLSLATVRAPLPTILRVDAA